MDISGFREQLTNLTITDDPSEGHLDLLAWLTDLSGVCGCGSPILVGCGAVEVYTNSTTTTGDIDVIVPDITKISAALLEIGFQRSSDQRFFWLPGNSVLFEFPSDSLRPGEKAVSIPHAGTELLVISPEDLIVNRLESFEAAGGGIDLFHGYVIYHMLFDNLDRERLRDNVKNYDVRESFIFIRRLHLETVENKFTLEQQAERLVKECRFRRGTA